MFINLRAAPSGATMAIRSECIMQLLAVKIGAEYDAKGVAAKEILVTCVCMSDGQQHYVLDTVADLMVKLNG